ncbi:alpha/beta fold hydrolase [Vibrio cholerae]|nr:alpha/beta fold hydrolase [Vibrio cholerae]
MRERDLRRRNNITELGLADGPVLLFAHGFGTDQDMWQRILPRFTSHYRVLLFDHVGSGRSDHAAYDGSRYSSLEAYTEDLLEICRVLDLRDVTLIGHSVGAMMAISAAARQSADSARIAAVVLMAASPSYMDRVEDGYDGGFSREDLDELFESLDANFLVWASRMAPVFMNKPEQPELGSELESKFQRTNPQIAREFARVAFLTDVRQLLPAVAVPALIMQCTEDAVAPVHIGAYMQSRLQLATLVNMKARGHFPQVSAPEETADVMLAFLAEALAPSAAVS